MTRQALVAAITAVLAVGLVQARGTALVSDLSITMTDGAATYTAGGSVAYTIAVGNAGPAGVVGAKVNDPVTALTQIASASWTCVGSGGATCTAGRVTGDIVDTVDMPVGGTVTYTLVVELKCDASGDLINQATVTPPTGTEDVVPDSNTATDTDTAATTPMASTAETTATSACRVMDWTSRCTW